MSSHPHPSRFFLAAALAAACAQALAAPQEVHFFTLENDAHFGTDRFYTNGVQWSAKHTDDRRGARTKQLTASVCAWLACGDATLLTTQTNVGQLMYTPRDITIASPQPQDRPWAGLLYLEQSWTLLSPDQRSLTTLSSQIGVTGRWSLAEPTQKLIHQLLDRNAPQGWDQQIGGTVGLLASAERRTALDAMSLDLGHDVRLNTASYWRLAAGNLQTYAAAGLAIVIGKDLPTVSPPPPGISNKLRAQDAALSSCLVPWLRCTAFGSVEARVVAYNIFLDGRLLHEDSGVSHRSLVHDLVFGTRIDFPNTRSDSHGPWFLQWKVTRRSPEFRSSLPVPRHRVMAVTIGTEF
ncbi:MAG: lipid A deacylase LpxR family protein [Massilia sp.]